MSATVSTSSFSKIKCPIVRNVDNTTKCRLTRGDFDQKLEVLAVKVSNKFTKQVHDELHKRNMLLKIPRIRNVVNHSQDPEKRIILLDPEYTESRQIQPVMENFLSEYHGEVVRHSITVGYEHWSTDDILRSILPEDIHIVSSFETVGHIAHLNLEPDHMPYKSVIGQVILDKNPSIKTVVTKTSEIKDEFRVFPMEIIAGDQCLNVQVKQNGCTFHFDYGKVYWNSRLENEHARIIQLFRKGQRICDVFCGVGPFAIPAAKNGCIVYANDLNPSSYDALLVNKKKNHVEDRYIRAFNMDGGEFIKSSFNLINDKGSKTVSFFDHYIMNLPAIAPQFLKNFVGIAKDNEVENLPIIHCYTFAKDGDDPLENIKGAFGACGMTREAIHLDMDKMNCHLVRKVSPNKEMYCVSFILPMSIAQSNLPIDKKQKTSLSQQS